MGLRVFVSAALLALVTMGYEMETEQLTRSSSTLRRLTAVVNALTGRIDSFEKIQVEDRLIQLQERFDQGATDVISAEDRLHEKIARAEHALQQLIEITRARTRATGGQQTWMFAAVAMAIAIVGIGLLRCQTHRVVRRANSEPVLGGFSPISGKQSLKKAW